MVDAHSDPPYGPESGLLFHGKGSTFVYLVIDTYR